MLQAGKTSPAALAELKQRVLWSLSKLSDRDTQQYAVEDLIAIVDRLTVDAIPTFLACLYDTDLQQKSFARKESVRLLGIMAAVHGRTIAPHLSKMIANVVQHFKDQDSKVRDACAETMGVIAAEAFPANGAAADGSSPLNPLGAFFRPLFEAMSEQNRNIQLTAAASLGRVIQCTNIPLASSLPKLCPRVVKSLSAPNFLAKAPLLDSVRTLIEVTGPDIVPFLPVLLPPTLAAFLSPDWMTRKAGAHVVQQVATSVGSAASAHKETLVAKLEKHRFDKVKAVRDAVSDALNMWKDVEDAPRPTSYSQYRLKHGRPSLAAEVSDQVGESPSSADSPTMSEKDDQPIAADISTPESVPEAPEAKPVLTPRTPARPSPSPARPKRPPTGTRVKRTSLREMRQASPGGWGGSGDKWAVEVAVPKSARYKEEAEIISGGSNGEHLEGDQGGGNEHRRKLDMSSSDVGTSGWGEEGRLTREEENKPEKEGSGSEIGEVKWEKGSERAQEQERELEGRGLHGASRLLEIGEGGESPVDPSHNRSARWMDSSVVRSFETVTGQNGEVDGGVPGLLSDNFGALQRDDSHRPNGASVVLPSPRVAALAGPLGYEEAKPSPRERRKWGQPEVGHLQSGEHSVPFGADDPQTDLASTQRTEFSPSETSHEENANASYTGQLEIANEPAGSSSGEGPSNGVAQRAEFERGPAAAAEELEERLTKWGGVAQGLARSGGGGGEWIEVKQQLARLEQQQAQLMTMLQDMVTRSQTALNGVESRVSWMERRLDEALSQQTLYSGGGGLATTPSPRALDGAFASSPISRLSRPQNGGVRRWSGTQYSNPVADPPATEHPFSFRPSPLREQLTRKSQDEPSPSPSTLPLAQRPLSARSGPDFADISASPSAHYANVSNGLPREYAAVSAGPPLQYADVSGGRYNHGDGASRRFAGETTDAGGSPAERGSPLVSRRVSGVGAEAAAHGAKAWSAAQEWLRHGKVEEAYMEVLSLGDELQLIRLLGRTGPVLFQLTPPTAAEVISILAVLLKQESFLDVILPWMHQLADPANDALLPRGLQREVVWALQVVAAQPTLSGSEAAKLVTTLCALWAPAFVE
ncbi:ARM repeat superfamily protein [Klebsormidium nitens]|uniref:ARM repeat superfamily protein n=1 Tax=Klebsormidium nitens TaxID=105231 RepID=A0A0U9HIJ8_KLENI|nr:ARM repeat superfamily protein [Klebsormidium nitens]|eukprot:GAQ80762.1 ARM repeat superfamily protein [Klebsormidium nitens]